MMLAPRLLWNILLLTTTACVTASENLTHVNHNSQNPSHVDASRKLRTTYFSPPEVFELRHIHDVINTSAMLSLTCGSAHLPDDVIDILSVNLERRLRDAERNESEVLATLTRHGEL